MTEREQSPREAGFYKVAGSARQARAAGGHCISLN
jgi:hypothetical protein